MAIGLVKDSSAPGDGSDKGFGEIVDQGWRRKRAVRPSEGYSKERHASACGARDAGPTGLLCSADIAATRPAFRFA